MRLYLNEQAPWERKREYFNQIQLGKDVRSQTELLSNAIRDQNRTQIASTSAIIVSQERISAGIDSIVEMTLEGFNRVTDGMSSLQASFEWGISEVVWQIEQNRNVLINILEVLMAPLNTQAKERKKRAEEAYANGWIDDAEEEFLASEKLNKYDFSIHISLGTIYLFNKLNKNKALEYYEKAIKYAKPKSPYYASYALLHKGLILFDFGKIEDAEKCTIEAIKLSPNFAEANYQNAQYNSLLGNINKSLSSLEKAISFDINYVLKADNDSLFNPIKIQFHQFIQNKVKSETASLSNSLKKLSQNFDLFYDNHISFKKIYNDFQRYIEEILTSVKGEKVYYGDIQMSMSGGQIHFANYYETTNNERYHMGTLERMKFATIKNGIENAKDLINRNSLYDLMIGTKRPSGGLNRKQS